MRTTFIFIMMIGFFILSVHPITVLAIETNVKDCLEENDDCLEQEQGISNDQQPLSNTSTDKSSSIIMNVLKIIFALALILLLIYLLVMFLKKNNKTSLYSGALENLGGISVGQQKSIQIIRIGEKVYALGIGNDVHLLDEITDKEVIQQLEESTKKDSEPFSFIQQILSKKSHKPNEQQQNVPTNPFSNTLKSELTKLKEKRGQLIDTHKKDDDIHE